MGFELTVGDLNELFGEAWQALLELLVASPPPEGAIPRPITLEAESLEVLLVTWLDELIYLVQTHSLLPVQGAVTVCAAPAGYRLTAELGCAPLDIDAHGWQGEVKGATFHGLELLQQDGHWLARVVLDV